MENITDEILKIAGTTTKRITENIEIAYEEAKRQSKSPPLYQDVMNICLILELAALQKEINDLKEIIVALTPHKA